MNKFEAKHANLFFSLAYDSVPRALGLCNRDMQSKTFGCCDRVFWHYCLLDVSNARMQEIAFLLSLMHAYSNVNNIYCNNSKIVQWVRGIRRFWADSRNSDGSCVEVYPFERSFCATSFSTAACLESILLDSEQNDSEVLSFRKTIEWIERNFTCSVGNQMAAALHVFSVFAKITHDKVDIQRYITYRDKILNYVDKEGFFSEYSGKDYGYQTISLASLIRVAELFDDDILWELILKARLNLGAAMNQLGEWDVTQNSRRTQFIYPSVIFLRHDELSERYLNGIRENRVILPTWMDDRYFSPLAIDMLLTARRLQCL